MNWERFAREAAKRGVNVRKCSDIHWQAMGLVTVNYYPFAARGRTIYVNGATKATEWGSMDDVFRIAVKGPELRPSKSSQRKTKPHKKHLLAKHPFCNYCGIPLTRADATIDHVLPLSRGGSNRPDNLVLACKTCNEKKGNQVKAKQ